MAIREVLQGCGAFDMPWLRQPPQSVLGAIEYGSSVVVFESHVNINSISETVRQSALYEGYIETYGSRGIDGYELSYLLGRPHDGAGPLWQKGNSFKSVSTGTTDLATVFSGYEQNGIVDGAIPATSIDILDEGTFGEVEAPAARFGLDAMMPEISRKKTSGAATAPGFSWRVSPGGLLDIDESVNLYRQHEVIFTTLDTDATGESGLRNVRGEFEWSRTVKDAATSINAAGDYILDVDGYKVLEYGITDFFDDQTLTYDAITGSSGQALEFNWYVDIGGGGNETAYEAVDRLRNNWLQRTDVSASARGAELRRLVAPGDSVYVDGDTRWLTDTAVDVLHFGLRHPLSMYVTAVTWSLAPGYMVFVRSPNGVYVDVSDYVVPSGGRPSVDGVELSVEWVAPSSANTVDRAGAHYLNQQRRAAEAATYNDGVV
jgi:hypothetical protein